MSEEIKTGEEVVATGEVETPATAEDNAEEATSEEGAE